MTSFIKKSPLLNDFSNTLAQYCFCIYMINIKFFIVNENEICELNKQFVRIQKLYFLF